MFAPTSASALGFGAAAAPTIQRSPAVTTPPTLPTTPRRSTTTQTTSPTAPPPPVQRLALGSRPAATPLPVLPTAPATTAVGAPSAFPVTTAAYPAAGAAPGPVTVSAVNRALPATRAVAAAASAASAAQRSPTVQRSLLGSAVKTVTSFAKEWMTGSSSSSASSEIRSEQLQAILSPMSPLRKSEYWDDLVKLLAECFRVTTKELTAYTDKTTKDLHAKVVAEIQVDEVLYSNTSRRLRTDMRIDRERFGRLRDGTR